MIELIAWNKLQTGRKASVIRKQDSLLARKQDSL